MASTQHLLSQEIERQQYGDPGELNHKTGVLMLRDNGIQTKGSHPPILRIFEYLKVGLLLTVSTSGEDSTVSVWSDVLEQPAVSPCRVLKSFTQIFACVSSQPNTKADEIISVTELDIEQMCSFNLKNEIKKRKSRSVYMVLSTDITRNIPRRLPSHQRRRI